MKAFVDNVRIKSAVQKIIFFSGFFLLSVFLDVGKGRKLPSILLRYIEKCSDSTSSELKSNHCWVTQQHNTQYTIEFYQETNLLLSRLWVLFHTVQLRGLRNCFIQFFCMIRPGLFEKWITLSTGQITISTVDRVTLFLCHSKTLAHLPLSGSTTHSFIQQLFFRGVVGCATLKLD